jgi:DNA-binding NtrC family response regulator
VPLLHPVAQGGQPAQRRLREQVRLAARTRAPVLLLGEPGTGKRWTARAIHEQGPDAGRAFVALDCARLPAAVVEAALFGGGGLAHAAGVGTLYLAEPQGLPRELQARLADWAAAPPGGGEGDRPGPRLLAGCAADPQAEVRRGRLLEELACALGVLTVAMPPLRERRAEFAGLVGRLLSRAADGRPAGLTAEAWEVLRAWPWPGNLRELYAVLQGACGRARAGQVGAEDLPWYLRSAPPPPPRTLPLKTILREVERRLIRIALRATRERKKGGPPRQNKTRAARLLGIWRALLVRRIEDLGIEDEGEELAGP